MTPKIAPKKPADMTIEELIEHRRGYKMTEEEMDEQELAIAAAEARHSGDTDATIEIMRKVRTATENG